MRHRFVPFVVIAAAACSKVDSSDVKTSGLYADLSVTAEGTGGVLAKAALKVGGATGTFVNLVGGDALAVSAAGGGATAMMRRELAGAVWYEAGLAADAADTSYTLAFSRASDTSAPDSTASLPRPFAWTAPSAGAAFSRGAAIDLAWSGGGTADKMRWIATGLCILPAAGDITGDTGAARIPAGRILPLDANRADTCAITIELVRTRAGKVSAAYGRGGLFEARQVRRLEVKSAP